MPDVNPQSLEEPAKTHTLNLSLPKRTRKVSILLSVAGAIVLATGCGAVGYWLLVHRSPPWFVDKPLYTARESTTGNRVQKIHSTLLYGADGKYAATNTVYEYGKPPAKQSYAGSWRKDDAWVCLRMDWMRDKEFCNAFIKTEQGWIVLNRTDARTTPISLGPLAPPSDQELAPPPSPASCTFAGGPVAHAASVTAFQSSTVTSGQPCQAEVRICTNGQLSGSFQNASCSAAIALPPTPAPRPRPRH